MFEWTVSLGPVKFKESLKTRNSALKIKLLWGMQFFHCWNRCWDITFQNSDENAFSYFLWVKVGEMPFKRFVPKFVMFFRPFQQETEVILYANRKYSNWPAHPLYLTITVAPYRCMDSGAQSILSCCCLHSRHAMWHNFLCHGYCTESWFNVWSFATGKTLGERKFQLIH